mmetsp:Transcript_2842/g.9347  ORF Transcript_2842/g.9347 Transcript_2842/m.9347 type:complete len:315 (-) Transcript_2842:171-1115(-)
MQSEFDTAARAAVAAQQPLRERDGPRLRRVVQRQVACVARLAHRSAVLDQPQRRRRVAVRRRVVERPHSAAVRRVDGGAPPDQPLHRLEPPLTGRQHERRPAEPVTHIDQPLRLRLVVPATAAAASFAAASSAAAAARLPGLHRLHRLERDGGGLVPPVRGGKVQQRVPPLVHRRGRRAGLEQRLGRLGVASQAREAERRQPSLGAPLDLGGGGGPERAQQPRDQLGRAVDRRLVDRSLARPVWRVERCAAAVQPLRNRQVAPAAGDGDGRVALLAVAPVDLERAGLLHRLEVVEAPLLARHKEALLLLVRLAG